MEYSFSGKISLKDYIQFNKNNLKKNEKIMIIIISVCIIIYLILDLRKYFTREYELNKSLFFEGFFPTIIFVISFLLYSLIVRKFINPIIYKKYYYSNKTISELQNYKITENEIIISSESKNITITKEKISKILYDENSIYIYVALKQAFIIKRFFFENSETFDKLVIFMKENY